MRIAYSNFDSAAETATRLIPAANFYVPGQPVTHGTASALDVTVAGNEVQVFVPV